MNPDQMRRVDRWIGVPSCGIATALARLRGPDREPGALPPAPRVAVLLVSEMGSTVLVHPALRRLRELRPGVELAFVIFEEWAETLAIFGEVPRERVLAIRHDSLPAVLASTLAAVRWLRSWRPDAVLDCELFSRFTALLSWASGAPRRAGFSAFHQEGLYRGDLHNLPVSYNPYRHIAENYLAQVEALVGGESHGEPGPKARLGDLPAIDPPHTPPEERVASVRDKIHRACPGIREDHRIVVLNPNASEMLPLRRWPLAHFQELARGLLEDPSLGIVLTGVASEGPDARAIVESAGGARIADLTGQTDLFDLLALYDQAAVMVSNDSGPPQLASATRLPMVVLYGPETPDLYAPLSPSLVPVYLPLACSPCVTAFNHRKSACRENVCLRSIPPAAVLTIVRAVLDGTLESLDSPYVYRRVTPRGLARR